MSSCQWLGPRRRKAARQMIQQCGESLHRWVVYAEHVLTERIREQIATPHFTGKGHRMVWARLRVYGSTPHETVGPAS